MGGVGVEEYYEVYAKSEHIPKTGWKLWHVQGYGFLKAVNH